MTTGAGTDWMLCMCSQGLDSNSYNIHIAETTVQCIGIKYGKKIFDMQTVSERE